MGGLFAATSHDDIVPLVIDGLASVEPHDCDSSGIGVLTERRIQRRRVDGPVSSLGRLLSEVPIEASTVLGHAGRAALGRASRRNAQPHASSRVAVAQVGILENHVPLRLELESEGVQFRSDTDSEVVVWLLDRELKDRAHPMTALQRVLPRLQGSFALAVICPRFGDCMYASRRGTSLWAGQSSDTSWLASNRAALERYAQESLALEDGQIAELRPGQVRVFDAALARSAAHWVRNTRSASSVAESGTFVRDRAHEEVMWQPAVAARVLHALERDLESGTVERWCGPLWRAERILALGCGDSYHAAHIARAWFEHVAGIPTELELSWELAARRPILEKGVVPLVVSSSQTDADALAALRHVNQRGVPAVALVHGSSTAVTEEAATVLDCTHAELEDVPTTAFLSQLCALAAASISARNLRGDRGASEGLPRSITDVPRAMEAAFGIEEQCAEIGRRIAEVGRAVFVGRGIGRPLASLGARRLEALAPVSAIDVGGGELKYGLRQRIEPGTPAVVLAADEGATREALSDARHVLASGGEPWLLGDARATTLAARHGLRHIAVDRVDPLWAPLVLAIPLQLIACHAARAGASSHEAEGLEGETQHKPAIGESE